MTLRPDDSTPPPPPPPPPPGTVLPPDILPAELQYKLIRRIGYGAYGEVYEAEAPGGVRVAVKRILRSIDTPAGKSELDALEAMRSVAHPFLLQTQAYWVYRDQLVIVMELAEGSLADRMKAYKDRGRPGVPPEELIPYFLQAAEALDYLHSQNVSHRDIKPHNLLYLKGYAKVADFGLARVHEHTQTTVGEHIGTPMYMAPEAWAKRISLQSDQYSLAATYVTARLGRGVFPSDLVYELALQHIQMAPDLDPLPAAEQQVLARALAKKPEERYPSCRAFVEALRDAALPAPVPLTPSAPARRARSWAVVAAALVCGLAIGGLTYWALTPPAPDGSTPEKLWTPSGWEPAEATAGVTLPDGRRYYKQLVRSVGGERLTAVAIAPARPADPPLFYMLQDKVSNRVFRAVWERAASDAGSSVALFRRNYGDRTATLLPGEWRKGAFDLTGENLGIDGDQEAVPVVNVTVPEAGLVADELGGQIPTPDQWAKAIGVRDDPARTSSAGSSPYDLGGAAPKGLALGLDHGPWPVGRDTPDVSVHGVRQLASNGYEWTRETTDGQPVSLFNPPLLRPRVVVVGQTWELRTVPTFAEIAAGLGKSYPWDDARSGVGFRVVLEPR